MKPKKSIRYQSLTVKVKLSDAVASDTLAMSLYNIIRTDPSRIVSATLGKDGLFKFEIPVESSYGYFLIQKIIPRERFTDQNGNDASYTTPMYYWIAGDDILLNLNKNEKYRLGNGEKAYFDFATGNGSKKHTLVKQADSIFRHTTSLIHQSPFDQMMNIDGRERVINFLNAQKSVLKQKKSMSSTQEAIKVPRDDPSETTIEVLKADFLFDGSFGNFKSVAEIFDNALKKNENLNVGDYLKKFQDFEKKYIGQISQIGLARSYYFPIYAIREAETEYLISHKEKLIFTSASNITLDSIIPIIKVKYRGQVLDNILANLLFFHLKTLDAQKTTTEVLASITNIKNKESLEKLIHSHTEGMPAYNFNLPDTSGKYHSLRSLKGKVVFQDFYYVGCGACAWLYENVLKDVEEHYKSNPNVVFVSISMDKNVNWLKKGIKLEKYNSQLSLNLYTEGKGFNHPISRYYSISGAPVVLLIDESGRIARFDTGDIRSKDGLIRQIDRLLKE